MMNKENNLVQEKLIRKEKLVKASFYKKNGLSSSFLYLAIIAEFIYITTVLDNMPISYLIGFTTMLNIFVLFMLFTCAVKVSVYSRQWTFVTLYASLYIAFRTLVLVPFVLQPIAQEPYTELYFIYISNAAAVVFLIVGFLTSLRILANRAKVAANSN